MRWLLLLFSAMPHSKTYKKYQLGRSSIYDLSKNICPTTRRNIPWLYALFLDGSRSSPAVRVASSAPEAGRRCIGRHRTATPPWSSCWSLRGPRWTRPATTAVAPEGFSGRFGSGSDEVTEGVRTLAADFRAFALGCWVVSALVVQGYTFVMGWASWNSGTRNEMKRVESRRNLKVFMTGFVFVWWFVAWSHMCLWNCDRRMEQMLTAELSDIFTASGRM